MSKHTFLVSDESINDKGFMVLTSGIDTTQFERNPIMLYMHQRPHIIGRWENLRKEEDKLFADAVFDVADPIANEVAGKVERGFLKGASIGIGNVDFDGDKVVSCNLFEISIVDIGANDNALRLYKDTQDEVTLKLNEINAVDGLTSFLGLKEAKNHTEIVELVKCIKTENNALKSELEAIKLAHKEEAKYLVNDALAKKLIQPAYKELHLKAFEEDFYKARIELANLYPFKRVSLIEMYNNATNERLSKGKEHWNLEDYRKLAPKELEQNPQLFQQLLTAEYGTDKR